MLQLNQLAELLANIYPHARYRLKDLGEDLSNTGNLEEAAKMASLCDELDAAAAAIKKGMLPPAGVKINEAARIQELEAGLRSIRGITRTAVARMKAPSSMKCIEDNCTLLLGDEPLDGVTP
jgi:hypothetical protein